MGMDIHIYHASKGKETKEINFGGRNRAWFNSLQCNGEDVYDLLDIKYGVSPYADEKLKDVAEETFGYFGHHYFKVEDFIRWFVNYHPDKTAGWVTTYDAWRIKNQGYIPSDPSPIMLENIQPEDQVFMEFPNLDDCSEWLYDYIIDNNIPKDDHITYWFDC